MVNVTLTFIPVCLFCSIVSPGQNETAPAGLVGALAGLPEALDGTPLEGLPDTLAELLAENPAAPAPLPGKFRSDPSGYSMLKVASIISASPLTVRQVPATTVQELLAPLTTALGNLVPALRRRPQPAPTPVVSQSKHEEKAVHQNHDHAEPAHTYPQGVVPDGFFYQGIKANGEYFNEEKQESDSLEVHSHDEVSPGKFYDDKSEHPYYVVDRPAEGPAPPPLTYFTSGLRSESDPWNDYYVNMENYNIKLKEYNDYFYPYYQRNAKNVDVNKNLGIKEAVQLKNTEKSEMHTNINVLSTNIDKVLEEHPGAAA